MGACAGNCAAGAGREAGPRPGRVYEAVCAVQGVLEFLLAFLGQGGLQDGAAELAHGLDGLVRGDLLDHQEQRRGAGLEHAADLLLELAVDAGLGDLAHQRAETGADGDPEDGHEEQQAEQQSPEHAPARPGTDRVVAGVHVVLALVVADDHGDRVRLDDEVLGQPPRLVGRRLGGRLVGVSDRNQVRHGVSYLLLLGCGPVHQPGGARAPPATGDPGARPSPRRRRRVMTPRPR